MQQQYQLTFTTPLAPAPKKPQGDLTLPDDLASLQTVWSPHTLHAVWTVSLSRTMMSPACRLHGRHALCMQHCLSIIACLGTVPCRVHLALGTHS